MGDKHSGIKISIIKYFKKELYNTNLMWDEDINRFKV